MIHNLLAKDTDFRDKQTEAALVLRGSMPVTTAATIPPTARRDL